MHLTSSLRKSLGSTFVHSFSLKRAATLPVMNFRAFSTPNEDGVTPCKVSEMTENEYITLAD